MREWILLVPLLLLGLTTMAAFDVVAMFRAANDSGRQMEVSYRVIAATKELYAAVANAETDQRIYLLTKKPVALAGFNLAKAHVTHELGELAKPLENSKEAPRFKAISRLSTRCIASLQTEIDFYEKGVDPSAQFRSGCAKMRELREAIARLVSDEERLIEQRQIAIERAQFIAAIKSSLAVFGLLLTGGLGGSVFFRTQAELSKRTDEARTADLKFEAMFDQAAVGMALISTDGRWMRLNDRFCAISGYSQDHLAGRNFQEITHPDDVAAEAVHISDLLTGKTAQCYAEKRFVRPSGEVVWANASAAVIRFADGTPNYIVKIIEDITSRKAVEEILRKSEERLRVALASGRFGTWSIDAITGQVELDSISISILDVKPGWNPVLIEFASLIHPDDQSRFADDQKAIMGDTPTVDSEYHFVARDGSLRWVQVTGARFGNEDDTGTRMIGIVQDITEQKEAVEKFRQGEEKLRLALASGNLGTWSFDSRPGILRFDQLAESIFGVDKDHLDSLADFKALLHPDDRTDLDREHQKLLAGSDALDVEYRLLQDNGSVRWVHVSGTIDRSVKSDSWLLIGVVADVTDNHEADERHRSLQNEFAHLARVNDLGEMAAAIAHEINQPLTAISNYLSAGIKTARKSADPLTRTSTEQMMERAAEQALRAGQIVRGLREFIGKGSGERDIRPADQLIDGALEFATLDARVKGVKVIRKAGAGDALVSIDVVQFEQIVVNLVRNAIESLSTNAPGVERELTVETEIGKSGKTVEFKVTDTGPGIDPVVFPKLFEPFTTSKANGMGMGLSITKRLIEAHGGVITIESPVCGGATFHFSLPAVVAMA